METNAFVTDDQPVSEEISSYEDFNRAYPPIKTFSFYRMLAFSIFGAALFILAIILAMPEGAGINWLAIGLAFVGIYISLVFISFSY